MEKDKKLTKSVKSPKQPKSESKLLESRGAKNSKLSKERMFKYNEALFWTILHFDKTMNAVIKVPRKIQRKTYFNSSAIKWR